MNIECGIYFQSPDPEKTAPSAKIGVQDKTSPYLMICTPNKGNIEITTGTGQSNVGGELLLRGYNVRIGVPNGSKGKVFINDEEAITTLHFNPLKEQVTALEQKIAKLERDIDRLEDKISSSGGTQ